MSHGPSPLAAANPRIKELRRLLGRRRLRRETGRFVLEGPVLVADAVARGVAIEALYVDEALCLDAAGGGASDEGVVGAIDAGALGLGAAALAAVDPACIVPVRHGVLAGVLGAVTPQPIAAVCAIPTPDDATIDDALARRDAPVIVLAAIADPGNVGTIIRSAAAAGAAAVVVGSGSADPFGPKAVRAAAGAVLAVTVVETDLVDGVARCARAGRAVWLAEAGGAVLLGALDRARPLAFVIGNESHGIPDSIRDHAAGSVRIPMAAGAESLNAAMAATVLLFAAADRGPQSDGRPDAGAA